MNIRWALLVEGQAAQLYTLDGGRWSWSMINDEHKRLWRAVAKGRLRRGIGTGFRSEPITPKIITQAQR